MSEQPGPLDGIKVVELAQNAAIPHCGKLLAGLGADVVKVEPPEGDAMRALAQVAPSEGRAYAAINPGKRSIAVDLAGPGASEVVDRLFAWADVALVAFKLPDLKRFSIDWEHARSINPALVYLSGTASGPEGPDADQGGYDVLAQGRSGLGWMMNRSAMSADDMMSKPLPTRPAINDFGTGFVSAFAVLAALRHRDQTGEGQRVDTSLLGTAISLGTPVIASFPQDVERYQQLDEDLQMLRSAGVGFNEQRAHYDRTVVPAGGAFQLYFRHYQTADGLVSLAGLSSGLFVKFHQATGIDAPTVHDPHDEGFQAVVREAEQFFAGKTSAEAIALLREVGYPCGPYNMPHEAVVDEQVLANDYVVALDHPTIGTYRASGMPFAMERSRSEIRGASPRFGEHSRVVLEELGIDRNAIDALVTAGTVSSPF